jgi:hypothetical protein
VAVRNRGDTAFAAGGTSSQARHFGARTCLVDENELAGIKIGLTLDPDLPFRGYVGALLLGGMRSLFLCVIRRRAKKRQIVEIANC